MKVLNWLLCCFLAVSLIACAGESKPKPIKVPNKTTKVAKKKKAAPNKKKKPSPYWTKLQKELKLNANQVKQLRKLHSRYMKEKKALPKVNGKPDSEKLRLIQSSHRKRMKKLLGDKLYAQKVAFDKKQTQLKKQQQAKKKQAQKKK